MVEENDQHYGRTSNKNVLLKIVILGDGGVGKSCLMSRFISNHFDDHNFHTIGVEFMNKMLDVSGKQYTLQIWDTAGQERFKSLRTPFYRGTDICILAYAIDDRGSFNNIKTWLNEFLHYAGVKNGIEKFPFVVVGNKSDVSSKDREVSHDQLKQWCEQNKIGTYIETSAKTDNNVVEAFSMAVQRWANLEEKAERELRMLHHPDTVTLHGSAPTGGLRATCCSRFMEV
ncbi:ras-related protein Rab-9B [Pieris rapae]|uniref:ras-related protein Rab-9B n=1 Tax=Pieris rapae TaxID=64459 RepID=UPI000B92B76D|nr:ras-related protein Rab-9B [Pieris rapae]XP_045490139.1 ras-related protein Rab-9B [Pieris rapae]